MRLAMTRRTHPPPHPPLVSRSSELSEMSNEEEEPHHTSYLPLVIKMSF